VKIKNFLTYIKENYEDIPEKDTLEISIDEAPYSVKRIPSNKNPTFEIKNMLGMDGFDILQKSSADGCGVCDNSFKVWVTNDTIRMEIFKSFIEGFPTAEDALYDAVASMVDKYNSIGWEFLKNK
jgi:hypothetical protein